MGRYVVILKTKGKKDVQYLYVFEANSKQEAIIKAKKEVYKVWKGHVEVDRVIKLKN